MELEKNDQNVAEDKNFEEEICNKPLKFFKTL